MDEFIVEIRLPNGLIVMVDPRDIDMARFFWNAYSRPPRKSCYAIRTVTIAAKTRKTQFMHRVIFERVIGRTLLPGEQVDHINGNGLDNRRANLRLATNAQNTSNGSLRCNSTSGLKGATWHKKNKKWSSQIIAKGSRKHLGYFDTPQEAHEAYKAAAIEHHGEFARFE